MAWKSMGFYATRFVEAPSAQEAEMKVLGDLQNEGALARDPSTPGLQDARVFFEEIEEVPQATASNTGFTFFDENA
jgi:hypothetical protein